MFAQKSRLKIPKKDPIIPTNCCLTKKTLLRLNTLQTNGRLELNLKEKQLSYIKEHYSYNIVPILYEVETRKFRKYKDKPSILKKLSKAAYRRKKFISCPLKKQDIDILNIYEINFHPIKYVITTKN